MYHADGCRGVVPECVDVARVGDVASGPRDARAGELGAECGDGGVDARGGPAADAHSVTAHEEFTRERVPDTFRGAGDDDAEALGRGRSLGIARAVRLVR